MEHTPKVKLTVSKGYSLDQLLQTYWQLSSTMSGRPGFEPMQTQEVLKGFADLAGVAQHKSHKLEVRAAERLQSVILGYKRPKKQKSTQPQNVVVIPFPVTITHPDPDILPDDVNTPIHNSLQV